MMRVTTENSVYLLDTENMRYMRQARNGQQEIHSYRLTYDEWHPLRDWCIEKTLWSEEKVLRLWEKTSTVGIVTSPIVEVSEDE